MDTKPTDGLEQAWGKYRTTKNHGEIDDKEIFMAGATAAIAAYQKHMETPEELRDAVAELLEDTFDTRCLVLKSGEYVPHDMVSPVVEKILALFAAHEQAVVEEARKQERERIRNDLQKISSMGEPMPSRYNRGIWEKDWQEYWQSTLG